MDKREILNNTTDAVYCRGTAIYKKNGVVDFHVGEDEYNDACDYIEATVKGSGRNYYDVYLTIEDGETIIDSNCTCPAYDSYPYLCKHCVAVALEYIDYEKHNKIVMEEHNRRLESLEKLSMIQKGMKRQTSPGLKSLLRQQSYERLLPFMEEGAYGKVRLEPILEIESDQISAEFRIGYNKMYVLKDVFAFEKRITERKDYSYGKNLEFHHSIDAFAPESRDLVQFVMRWARENRSEYERPMYYGYRYGYDTPATRYISLSTVELERFFIAMKGRDLLAYFGESGQGERTYHVSSEPQKLKIRIDGGDDGIQLRFVGSGGILCINHMFAIEGDKINRIDFSGREKILNFVECMLDEPGQLFIEKEDLKDFCNILLPEIKKTTDCEIVNFDESEYIIPEPEFKIFLDMPQKYMITIKPIAIYDEKEILIYDNDTNISYRDLQKEQAIKKLVEVYTNAYHEKEKMMVLGENDELLYQLLSEGIERMQQVAEVYISDAIKRIQIVTSPNTIVGVSLSGDLLELKIEADSFSMDELVDLLSRYQKKKKYYRLKNGNLVHMEDDDIQKIANIKNTLQLTDKELKKGSVKVPKFRALYLDEQLEDSDFIQSHASSDFVELVRNIKTIEENEYTVPKSLEDILRNYQKEGFQWLKSLYQNGFGGILADDMGLGKSLQVITFLLSEIKEAAPEKKRRVLIVCPASLVFNWKSEFEKFAPELSVKMIIGNAETRAEMIQSSEKRDILITSYDLLRRDVEVYEKVEFFCQVIDEAQYIKNSGTQSAKAVKLIHSGFRLALTGTPVENRLSELWSIFDYLMPGFLYNYKRFKEQMEQPIVKENDEQVLERLQKMIRPFVLRRLKKDVLKDLPDKLEENKYVQMQGEQRKIYDAHVKRMKMMLEKTDDDEFRSNKIQILAELTKLRQMCCDPSILFEQYGGESAKTEMCIDLIRNAVENGHKILLFSQFTSMLENLQKHLKKEKITFYSLTGSTPKEKRAQMVAAFNEDDTSVFCISLKAGGTGLNLTSADIVIHYDPWWNVAVQNQATDRAHRIGQKNVVTVYKLITKDTIEENIVHLQERKMELADKVLSGEGISSVGINREELIELLQ